MRQALRTAIMPDAATLPTTQRAYTLRLRGIDNNDSSWRDALWATHEAVNKGAKVFGDWLLTLRGGLDHQLADQKVKTRGKPDRDPTPEERKNRRILLALSWLSVEDERGAPPHQSLIVAKGTESADCREQKLSAALTTILKSRGAADSELGNPDPRLEDQPGTWLGDCMPSLSAAIRDDAVWVNRSMAFDAATRQCPSLTRNELWDFLEPFFASAESYFRLEHTDPDEEGCQVNDGPAPSPSAGGGRGNSLARVADVPDIWALNYLFADSGRQWRDAWSWACPVEGLA
jgi:hypothetical protein